VAVYTALTNEALRPWLASHDVGSLVDCQGIAAGIENSNFFVTTLDGGKTRQFVLTIFERLSIDELPYYLSLMKHLATHDVRCPEPIADRAGALCGVLAGKPAALVTRLPGRSVSAPTAAHCATMGGALARMHLSAAGFAGHQINPRGVDWWIATAARVHDFLDPSQRALLDEEIGLQASSWKDITRSLPHGAIHADLFRDNALFVEGSDATIELGGVIDFYFAGDDAWVFDLAVCLNDWCIDLADGSFDRPTLSAFIDAYQAERPLTSSEREALPQALRAAALRFWLSRVDDLHRPRPAQLLTPHDPTHFERILRRRRDEARNHSTPFPWRDA
jgi:homoserine kinase type II